VNLLLVVFTAPNPLRLVEDSQSVARCTMINGPSLGHSVVYYSTSPAFDVLLDECIPLAGDRLVTLASSRLMSGATGKLSGPFP
jgi:hypothetical protein